MDAAMVAQVRRFNRAVTLRAGALDDRFLAQERPLVEARVLWEIGEEGCEVRALRSRLGLDSGHASRLLRALEADGLVEVVQGATDRRARSARLTPAGLAEREVLDRRSDELARSFLEPLTPAQRDRLVGAMRDVERLLTAALVEIREVDPSHPDARQCLRSYFAELERRSGTSFDPTTGSTAEPHEIRPPAGVFLVAYLREAPVGCGALKHFPGGASDLKRMWVAESARGLGIGRRLLAELESRAAGHGSRVVRLETNRVLAEAIALYESAGYAEVPPFNDEPFADGWFEKRLRP
ncbi:MAG TPA: bifunctional helix-turn-helix transcriptional regulator/GNAT family N-acetyltransferase [Gaiellaceae bacterium]|nr:bifunctional helix-turn-helix transcriptional regulator/GNAT family N-acetyltransferase [Gaiellaceae bacterium]